MMNETWDLTTKAPMISMAERVNWKMTRTLRNREPLPLGCENALFALAGANDERNRAGYSPEMNPVRRTITRNPITRSVWKRSMLRWCPVICLK